MNVNTSSWWFQFATRYNENLKYDQGRRKYANTVCSMVDNVAGGWAVGLVICAMTGWILFSMLIAGYTWAVYGIGMVTAGAEAGGYLAANIEVGRVLLVIVGCITIFAAMIFTIGIIGAYVIEPVLNKIAKWRDDRRQAYLAQLANPQVTTPASTVLAKWWQDRKIKLCSMVSYDGLTVLPETDQQDYND